MSEKQDATKALLEEVETELGELGEVVEEKLNSYFQEEYEVVNVSVDEETGLILVSVKILPDED